MAFPPERGRGLATRLPYEVWLEIYRYLDPKDMSQLALTETTMSAYLRAQGTWSAYVNDAYAIRVAPRTGPFFLTLLRRAMRQDVRLGTGPVSEAAVPAASAAPGSPASGGTAGSAMALCRRMYARLVTEGDRRWVWLETVKRFHGARSMTVLLRLACEEAREEGASGRPAVSQACLNACLFHAVARSWHGVVEGLLEVGASPVTMSYQPLMLAVDMGDMRMTKLLLERSSVTSQRVGSASLPSDHIGHRQHGPTVAQLDYCFLTSCRHGRIPLAKYLLSQRQRSGKDDGRGAGSLDEALLQQGVRVAKEQKQWPVVQWLEHYANGESAVMS